MEARDLDLKIPWFGGAIESKIPVTARSSSAIVITFCITIMITAIMCSYLIFVRGNSENIGTFGHIFISKPTHRNVSNTTIRNPVGALCKCPEPKAEPARLKLIR